MDTSLPVSMIVELTLALLLAATLVCCFSLERRLKNLRKDQDSLNGTVRALNGAIVTASASIARLRAAAEDADKTLGTKVNSARALVDELSHLTQVCERIATRMEGGVQRAPVRGESLRAVR
jgi:Flp pilus assembly protein TadB